MSVQSRQRKSSGNIHVLRVIMLNNNLKILLVSFVHHIELQNFLNAPRIKKHAYITLVP